MNQETKKQIAEALTTYAKEKALSQEQLARATGLNVSYINALMNGDFSVGKTPLKDAHLETIASAIGMNISGKTYWRHTETPQFTQIFTELLDGKVTGRVKVIIAKTGHGKTYSVNYFKKEAPVESHFIKLSSLHKLNDIIDTLCDLLGVEKIGSPASKLQKMATKLYMRKANGLQPFIAFDEAENANIPTLRMIKAFYDVASPYCCIALIGTPKLLAKLEYLRDHDVDGMPQVYRRLKAGIRVVRDINKEKDYAPFLEPIDDINLRTLITTLADNYGELNDYVEYALREADRQGLPLTEKLFKQLFALD
ncbi:DNA transposition AAA+ family ATPase [Dysgonomonas sp. PFB1-18]|uniref:AAA family ATPase n=1 Tax=unclassified Dysgonomonas TaxID=2630389 RepID=UPI002473C771|nr:MULTISPECIES: AAA family ATPase [unclassified Dysgonomonas]MDH6310563.1 DNA transposition AAA+ family ATPase [Dysgonomonas sp. PF1-14]MDH6340413.1 DNA transposition AAA+ family ATPase [Dysgonomonas sp. PF1-16]MDH6382007.1 DNA transposition AAA+ family ATPase [Dysgonomonas sp. PFB1-18]MDH6399384.1 DNA transposition AAA+ family ATPase [Dysgonomonas sp. PF1-23]